MRNTIVQFALTSLLVLLAAKASSMELEVETIELKSAHPYTFIAPLHVHQSPRLFVLESGMLSIYAPDRSAPAEILPLPLTTTAVDVADLDGDGFMEVIYVAEEKLFQIHLREGLARQPKLLFVRISQLSVSTKRPYPHVLVIEHEGNPAIALPIDSSFEFWSPEGELLETMPLGKNDSSHPARTGPIIPWTVNPPQAGSNASLEHRVVSTIDGDIEVPLSAAPATVTNYHLGNLQLMLDAAVLPGNQWPWFPLKKNDPNDRRVLYALHPPEYTDTLIRFKNSETRPVPMGDEPLYATTKRRYPGRIIVPRNGLPDFNGDGYQDILMWRTPLPGTSLDGLLTAAQKASWKLSITTHTYNPRKGLYNAAPSAHLKTKVPINWFMELQGGAPIHNLILRDFNQDGFTDVGFSTEPNQFEVWLYNDGFEREADFTHTFPSVMVRLEDEITLTRNAGASLIFSGPKRLYLLRVSEN